MKFLGKGFQKLEHEQDTETDRQRRPNALAAAAACID